MQPFNTDVKKLPDFVYQTEHTIQQFTLSNDPYQPLIGIYLLRLAIALNDHLPEEAIEKLFSKSDLGKVTGLYRSNSSLNSNQDQSEVQTHLDVQSELPKVEKMANQLTILLNQEMELNAKLFVNIHSLAKQFNLSSTEQELLALGLLMNSHKRFNEFLNEYCVANENTHIPDYLSVMTSRPAETIKKSLDRNSLLYQMGWLDGIHCSSPAQMISNTGLLAQLFNKRYTDTSISKLFFKPCKQSELSRDAYPSLKEDLAIVIDYLKTAVHQGLAGVNIVIHGKSTQGKRELAQLIAKEIDCPLNEILQCKLSPKERFSVLKSTQAWIAQQSHAELVLFSQADDLLPRKLKYYEIDDEEENTNKVDENIIKKQFTSNTFPTIWIIDKPSKIKLEILQLFDYALQVDQMPTQLREISISQATQDLTLRPEWINQTAKRSDILLSQIQKAVHITKHANQTSQLDNEKILEQILNGHARLFNNEPAYWALESVTHYDLQFTNTSIALSELVSGLRRHPFGRYCFYGAPGTGKTAFAIYLAEQTGIPVMIKNAADILDMYIGESEKNISKIFAEAKEKKAILLIDEADTFLSDRKNARHNWEISMINSMLIEMERFNGILICTTNLMSNLDNASLRRFDFKVKFDYLTADQRWALFKQECKHLGSQLPEGEQLSLYQTKIEKLTTLTPGDFAVLARQAKFREDPFKPDQIITILEDECATKGEQFTRIGFVH
jgi:DNA replication protein DnaC